MLAIKYALFAVIATALNFAAQWSVDFIYTSFLGDTFYPNWLTQVVQPKTFYFLMGMFFGTGVGLVCKYILDKKYIFYHTVENVSQDVNTFMIYTLTGVVTTLLFWTFEIVFHFAWEHHYSKYIGAAIGLSIGYISKYYLDKHFVFKKTT